MVMAEFVSALKAEIANLEAAKRLTDQRLAEARRMLALYEPSADVDASGEKLGDILGRPPYAPDMSSAKLPTRMPSPERAKVLELAQTFLAGRMAPTPTAVIYDHVISMGGRIGGNDPRNNLSAMLSNSDLFRSHGRSGWTLVRAEASDKEPPEPAPSSALADLYSGVIGGQEE